MTTRPGPLDQQVHGLLERIAGRGMLHVALAAFFVGVILHACVVYAVLDDGKTSSGASVRPVPANGVSSQPSAPAATATPSRLADRASCEAIRGTDYRSETERQWFRANCA